MFGKMEVIAHPMIKAAGSRLCLEWLRVVFHIQHQGRQSLRAVLSGKDPEQLGARNGGGWAPPNQFLGNTSL